MLLWVKELARKAPIHYMKRSTFLLHETPASTTSLVDWRPYLPFVQGLMHL